MDDTQFVATLKAQLQQRIGASRFSLWFDRHTKFSLRPDGVTVWAADAFSCDWLRRNFSQDLRACCRDLMQCEVRVEFEIDSCLTSATSQQQEQTPPEKTGGVEKVVKRVDRRAAAVSAAALQIVDAATGQEPLPSDRRPAHARPEPSLSSLVVGKCNEYAVAASGLVARRLQQASPVLVYGPTGVGKTHLLRGVRAEHRRCNPRTRAVYLTAEQFTTSFIEALRGSGLPSFRQKVRGADLLLLDDLQFFAGKKASLDELLHTVDTLQSEGRQVMLASDRGLAELRPLGRELVSRLTGGLTCEIASPDFATRLEIVGRLAVELELKLGDDVATLVATEITSTARELRGALFRLQAVSSALRQPIGRELAAKTLLELSQHSNPVVRMADVEQAICQVFGVERGDLKSDRKSRAIHEPRMLAMWLARKYTRAPWSEIGQYFGRRSHSTVIAAHHRVEKLIRTQAQIGMASQSCDVEDAIRRVETALRTA